MDPEEKLTEASRGRNRGTITGFYMVISKGIKTLSDFVSKCHEVII